MISQLRMYTINKGMMDQWTKYFSDVLIPMQEKHGIKVDGTWVNEAKNQFIWIRSFADSSNSSNALRTCTRGPFAATHSLLATFVDGYGSGLEYFKV